MSRIENQIKRASSSPGVYFFKEKNGKILYIGKARNLKARLSDYARHDDFREQKTQKMLEASDRVEIMETDSEIEALILESEMIKRYKPVFNKQWMDEKNYLWIQITVQDDCPRVSFVRMPLPDKSKYFGPFVDAKALKKSMQALRRVFGFRTSKSYPHKLCFWGHINQCPCVGTDKNQYRKDIRSLVSFLEGRRKIAISHFEGDMRKASNNKEYEKAAIIRDRLSALRKLTEMTISAKYETKKRDDRGLADLFDRLGLSVVPQRIEAYDISNLYGQNAVGSMIVFERGIPDKASYRKFKIKGVNQIDDYAMIREILTRRFTKLSDDRFKILPDLIVIDGGKGQLSPALRILDNMKLPITAIGIAKKNEEVFLRKNISHDDKIFFRKVILPKDSHALYLLQRIRDEAHRFAIIYHKLVRDSKTRSSRLDEISGIGDTTKRKLLSKYKSIESIKKTSLSKLAEDIGLKKAALIKKNL